MTTKIILSALALVAIVVTTNAQNPLTGQTGRGKNQNGVNYVDNNKNGVCDTYDSQSANPNSNLGYGKGNRQGAGSGNGQGYSKGSGQGRGQGKGAGNGQGQGVNYTDTNSNGVCDTREKK